MKHFLSFSVITLEKCAPSLFLYRYILSYKKPTFYGKSKWLMFRKVIGEGNLLMPQTKNWFAFSTLFL